MKRRLFFALLLVVLLTFLPAQAKAAGMMEADGIGQYDAKKEDRWTKLLKKYIDDEKVDRLIFVKYERGSKADFCMYKKEEGWKHIIKCKAYVGRNGIDKKIAGDLKTPTGTFQITMGFGRKKNPGTKITYKKLNKYLYWSARKEDYNRLVDSRKAPGVYGEHLIDYKPHYNYALAMDFNKKGIYPKGSAIFLHCTGKNRYTAGCIAIKEANMKKVLKNVTKRTKICIYKK